MSLGDFYRLQGVVRSRDCLKTTDKPHTESREKFRRILVYSITVNGGDMTYGSKSVQVNQHIYKATQLFMWILAVKLAEDTKIIDFC